MRRGLLIMVAAMIFLGIGSTSAMAATDLVPDHPTPDTAELQRKVNELFLPSPNGPVRVEVTSTSPEPGVEGWAWSSRSRILLVAGLRPGLPKIPILTAVHELGHIVDWRVNGADFSTITPQRQEFMDMVKLSGSWDADPMGPNEQYADWYASCAWRGLRATGSTNGTITSFNYKLRLSISRYNQVCAYFVRTLTYKPGLDPPGAIPPGDIPFNDTFSAFCTARLSEPYDSTQQCQLEIPYGDSRCNGTVASCKEINRKWQQKWEDYFALMRAGKRRRKQEAREKLREIRERLRKESRKIKKQQRGMDVRWRPGEPRGTPAAPPSDEAHLATALLPS